MSIEDSIKRLREAHAELLAGHDDGGREYLAACTPEVVGYLLAALDEREALRTALRFYARGEHYMLDEAEQFDTVSGEPQNWLMSGLDNSTTMVEDGTIARRTLRGEPINWIDGGEDSTPQPIEGESAARKEPT